MSRYKKIAVFTNEEKSSAIARRMRKLQRIVHYGTSPLYHPDVLDRSSLKTDTHIWKYGDRLYNLANKYYGNPELWWIIGWYNGAPTEAHLIKGDVIEIPINLENIATMLGV
jgi:nucleoid-associated protein YgaU